MGKETQQREPCTKDKNDSKSKEPDLLPCPSTGCVNMADCSMDPNAKNDASKSKPPDLVPCPSTGCVAMVGCYREDCTNKPDDKNKNKNTNAEKDKNKDKKEGKKEDKKKDKKEVKKKDKKEDKKKDKKEDKNKDKNKAKSPLPHCRTEYFGKINKSGPKKKTENVENKSGKGKNDKKSESPGKSTKGAPNKPPQKGPVAAKGTNATNNAYCAGKPDDKQKPSLLCGCGPPKPKAGRPTICSKDL